MKAGGRPIFLLTDFGLGDPFVGVMKGVILGLNPRAVIADLCHGIAPGDLRGAAFWLAAGAPYLPEGSLTAAVVDPGVGSGRRILYARSARREYLFPDNGVAGLLERAEPFLELREVSNRRLFLKGAGSTFDGRDIFAPIIARLSMGLNRAMIGAKTGNMVRRPFPEPSLKKGRASGEVTVIDRFGNAVTDLPNTLVPKACSVLFKGRRLGPLRSSYSQVPSGRPLAVRGSFGFVELSVRDGDFAARHGARPGDRVEAVLSR